MLRAFLAELVAREGIRWTFTYRERRGRWAARLSALLFPGSHRGTLLSNYFYLKEGKLKQVLSRMRGYYKDRHRRSEWGQRLDRWRSIINKSTPHLRRILPRLFSLAYSWQRSLPVPCQIQEALWKTGKYSELAELAQASGQIVLQAHALFADGKPEAALEQLKQISPEKCNGEATYVRARCLQAIGRQQEAVETLERAVAESGAGRKARDLLVELYRQTKQEEKANDAAERLARDYGLIPLKFKPPEDGHPYHLITEDHELTTTPGKSEGHPWLLMREARIQLIDKGRLVNNIAARCGTPWTHLIDIGSYTVLKAAAEQYPNTWGDVLAEFEAFLVETIATGNDLGVHVHPDKSWLAIEKIESDRVWLKRGAPGWGELPRFGFADDLSSKLGLITAGKKLVEQFARQIAPDFQATFFRSGAHVVSSTLFETAESMDALCQTGLWVGSDALEMDGITESLGRRQTMVYRAANDTPWKGIQGSGIFQALPLQTREFPVYSVVKAARRYVRDKQSVVRLERYARDKVCIIAIDHDIEIGNARAGGRWDDLNPSSGDWAALTAYLEVVGRSKMFKCIRANDLLRRS